VITSELSLAIGGLGLFLLGMVVMTDGLKELASDVLTRVLARFTKTALSGAVTGAAVTAVIQSSSATTVAAIGFVGAGLMTFSQALGVLFGANIGTTATGWAVALIGFKLDLGTVVQPLVLVGVLLMLFGRGRTRAAGRGLAGFALVFIGLGMLQHGMSGFEGLLTPDDLPSDSWNGRLLLVLIGIAITVVTQSSSAGVATALTAVHAGAISFHQAAAMVIGMDVGTTVTALLATLGASTQARRTGYAHVIYNLMTGIGAFFLIGPFVAALDTLLPGALRDDPELALVGFHSFFNTLGVVVALPFVRGFADLIERLVPERGSPWTRRLERSLLRDPPLASLAVVETLREIAHHSSVGLARLLRDGASHKEARTRLAPCLAALAETRAYVAQLRPVPEREAALERRLVQLIDHLQRLFGRCRRRMPARAARDDVALRGTTLALADALESASTDALAPGVARAAWEALERGREPARLALLARSSAGELSTEAALVRLDALRDLRRIAYHLWRILHHLERTLPRPVGLESPPKAADDSGPIA